MLVEPWNRGQRRSQEGLDTSPKNFEPQRYPWQGHTQKFLEGGFFFKFSEWIWKFRSFWIFSLKPLTNWIFFSKKRGFFNPQKPSLNTYITILKPTCFNFFYGTKYLKGSIGIFFSENSCKLKKIPLMGICIQILF